MSAEANFELLQEILLNGAARVQPGNVDFLSNCQDRSVPDQFDHTRCGEFDDELSPSLARGMGFSDHQPQDPEIQPVSFEVQRALAILGHEVGAGRTDQKRLLGVLQILGSTWGWGLLEYLEDALACWGFRLGDVINSATGHLDACLYDDMCAAIAAQEQQRS